MAIVPRYQPGQVGDRPIFQQRLTVRASAEAMGGGVARGLGDLAQGVGQVAQAIFEVRDLEDTARAKEADNRFASWVRERQYGENGYLTLEGRAAVDARSAFEAEVAKKRQEFGSDLTATAGVKYARASEARLNSVLDQSIAHSAGQRKAWFKQASTDRLDTFAEDALAGYQNPSLVTRNIAAGQSELRSMAELQGWDADTLANREAEFISGVHKNIALRVAQNDPLAADKYRKDNKDALTGPHQYELEAALGSSVREAEAVRITEEILVGGRSSGQSIGASGPTRARAILTERAVGGATRADAIENLDASFATNLAAMMDDAPPGIREGLGLTSGYRSEEVQAGLWAEALRKYGSEAEARKWVAPPGNSYHNSGQAVDLAWNGGAFVDAPKEVRDWVHANAAKYGMYFPMGHEPWHIEPMGTRGGTGAGTVAARNGSISSRAMMPGSDQIEAQLSGIADPQVRDLVRKRLNAQIEAQNKAASAAETAAKAELWRIVEAGGTPDQVPQNVRVAAGMSAVSSAWGYIESVATRGKPTDDDVLVYNMRRHAAQDPNNFSQINLDDYRERLSPETFKEMTSLQTSALSGERDPGKNLALTSAFSQATGALAAIGITTAGKEGAEREAAARREAQFNNSLAAEMAAFRDANKGRNPNQMEIQSMINQLLLPVVIESPGALWGTNKADPVPMFEVGRLGDLGGGRVASIEADYAKIPPAERIEIEMALEAEYGRKPSEEEVEAAYAAYLTATVTSGN